MKTKLHVYLHLFGSNIVQMCTKTYRNAVFFWLNNGFLVEKRALKNAVLSARWSCP